VQDLTSANSVRIGNLICDTGIYLDGGTRYDDALALLRRQAPVAWLTPDNYRPFWLISRHADVRQIEGLPTQFLNRPRSFLIPREQEEKLIRLTGSGSSSRSIVQLDEPDHRVLRNLTQSWFLPKRINTLEPKIRAIAVELIDKMAAGRATDFAADVALWYPLRVIMSILGMPHEDRHLALKWTRSTFSSDDPDVGGETVLDANLRTFGSISEYFSRVTEDRRANPRDDLATVLANSMVNGEQITALDANSYYWGIITAGHDTTSSTLAGGLLALLQHPDELAKLRKNPDLIDQAVNECLRWTTPVKHFFRTAVEDYELRGERIRAGDGLMMCYPSANRDEDFFEDPFSFKVDRPKNPHLAFGYGAHQCLGLHLSKLELRVFFEELLPRLESIDLDGKPVWYKANFVVGLKSLPISYRMRTSPARQSAG
jgi:cytochrome P450